MASWAHKVVESLVQRGEVSPDDVLDAVSAQNQHRIPPVEVLVLRGKLTEKRLLGELSKDRGVPAITSAALWKLKVAPDVLDRLPLTEAEAMCVVPIRFEKKEGQLAVAVASLDTAMLERLNRSANAESIAPVLATTYAIRAGIQCFYYQDREAFRALSNLVTEVKRPAGKCRNCGAPLASTAPQCAECGLLGTSPVRKPVLDAADSSIVRSLLSPKSVPTPSSVLPKEGLVNTVQFNPQGLIDENVIPTLVAGLDAALRNLQPFEAHVASFVDGKLSVVQIAKAVHLSSLEICAVLRGMERQQLVSLEDLPIIELDPETDAAHPALDLNKTMPGVPPHLIRLAGKMPKGTVAEGSPRGSRAGQSVLQRAVTLERQGKIDEAISVLEAAIDKNRSAVLLNRLALIILDQRKDTAKAANLLRRAVELQPDNAAYQANLLAVMALSGVELTEPSGGMKATGKRLLKKLKLLS